MKFCLLLFCVLLWTSVQAISIAFRRAECKYHNEEYISTCQLKVTKDEELYSKIISNLEIIKQPPKDLKLLVQLYYLVGGKYETFGAPLVDSNYCEVSGDYQTMVPTFVPLFGIGPDNCPAKPGSYGTDRFVLYGNEHGLPESLPPGNYQIYISVENGEMKLAEMDIDATVN